MFGSLFRAMRNNLLIGLVIITPIAVTFFLVVWLIRLLTGNPLVLFLRDQVLPFLPASMQDSQSKQWLVQGLALLILLGLILLLGFMVRSFLGKKLYGLGELVISRIPVVNRIYIWIRQISEGFLAQRQSMFKEVALVAYPRPGLYSIGFVTAEVPAKIQQAAGEKDGMVALFIPTTPNPTSGMMILAPRSDVHPLSISVSDAMKLIISAGAVHPGDDLVDERPTLLDKLETWLARDRGRQGGEEAGGD